MEIIETKFKGCFKIIPEINEDSRGNLTKYFKTDIFKKYGLKTEFTEEYFSISRENVLRGLHFQNPPSQLDKLVTCTYGGILSAVVDIRYNSPSYGQFEVFELNETNYISLYIPEGFAFGYYVERGSAVVNYKVTEYFSKENDSGILWNSIGIPWVCKNPVLSERDKYLVPFKDLNSEFYQKG
jgi:dTDP-4-dehydrorhamnose 3,5-epimerase